MRLREFYNHFLHELQALYSYEEAAAISTIIFEHSAQKSRTDIITDPGQALGNETVAALEQALLQLKRNIPVQYVTGQAWFMDLTFKVDPSVLIPRPETEELVKEAIRFIQKNNAGTVLDIGTGSGCIPVSIKKELPGTEVTAIDVSRAALDIARQNAGQNNVSINWLPLNFLLEKEREQLPVFDVIISNPPYIPEEEKDILDKNVTEHEPHLALFVPDNNALLFYKEIAAFALNHLAKEGCIFMETHELFATAVAKHFIATGFEAIVKKDFFGKDRIVIANPAR